MTRDPWDFVTSKLRNRVRKFITRAQMDDYKEVSISDGERFTPFFVSLQ